MSWRIELRQKARAGLGALPAEIRDRAAQLLTKIAENPFSRSLPGVKKLKGLEHTYSVRLRHECRIIFMVSKPHRAVNVIYIGPRGGAYRNAEAISDRAKRYRAQKAIAQPDRRCIYCGAPGARDVDHINGIEDDNAPENLAYACIPCNTAKGARFARLGIGRRTQQFNPRSRARKRRTAGARNLAEWVMAVMSIKGQGPIPVAEAVRIIRATPPADRSDFAYQIWQRRRERGTDRLVPF